MFQLPFDEDDFSYLNTVEQHNLINEWSDSSDSGVSGKLFFHSISILSLFRGSARPWQ